MTNLTTTAGAVFAPRGRPVARFVAAITLLSALLVLVWVTGVFNPRVTVGFERWKLAAIGDATLVVRNESPTAAVVKVVDVSDLFVRLSRAVPEVRIAGGEESRMTVFYKVDCAAYARAVNTAHGATAPVLNLVLEVRGSVGPSHRSVMTPGDAASLERACPGS